MAPSWKKTSPCRTPPLTSSVKRGTFTHWPRPARIKGRDEDALAFFRTDREFQNHLLLEQPNGHFGDTIVRQLFFSAFALERYAFLSRQLVDAEVAGIAAKAVKELQYHWEHAAQWVIRLGDGTEESHRKVQESVNELWSYTGEMFVADDVDTACKKPACFQIWTFFRQPGANESLHASNGPPSSNPKTDGCNVEANKAFTANTSATCWPRCKSFLAPIPTQLGDGRATSGAGLDAGSVGP